MGKNKNSSSKRPKLTSKNTTDSIPSFDESALSALTEKIEQGLSKTNAPRKPAEPANRSHKQEVKTNGRKPKELNAKNSKLTEQARGTKRDSKGNAKPTSPISQSKKSVQKGNTDDDRATLLKEILALGGTEEDLDLVADAASDDEELDAQESATTDKTLKKDLAKFVASLGINAQLGEEADDSEDEEPVEDEWEEASDLDTGSESEEEVEEVRKIAPIREQKTKANGAASIKDANRLVSKFKI